MGKEWNEIDGLANNQTTFLAKVAEISQVNNDVGFNVMGRPPFAGKFPQAARLGDSAREMKIGDTIRVTDILGTDGMHAFYYEPIREDPFVGLMKMGLKIEITDGQTIKITGDCAWKGNIEITGNLDVTGTITATEDVIGGGISLKGHTHNYNPGPGTPTPSGPPNP